MYFSWGRSQYFTHVNFFPDESIPGVFSVAISFLLLEAILKIMCKKQHVT